MGKITPDGAELANVLQGERVKIEHAYMYEIVAANESRMKMLDATVLNKIYLCKQPTQQTVNRPTGTTFSIFPNSAIRYINIDHLERSMVVTHFWIIRIIRPKYDHVWII